MVPGNLWLPLTWTLLLVKRFTAFPGLTSNIEEHPLLIGSRLPVACTQLQILPFQLLRLNPPLCCMTAPSMPGNPIVAPWYSPGQKSHVHLTALPLTHLPELSNLAVPSCIALAGQCSFESVCSLHESCGGGHANPFPGQPQSLIAHPHLPALPHFSV